MYITLQMIIQKVKLKKTLEDALISLKIDQICIHDGSACMGTCSSEKSKGPTIAWCSSGFDSLQEMVLYMIFFFDLLRNRHRNILPVTFHCSGDISVTAMLVFVIFERHRMVQQLICKSVTVNLLQSQIKCPTWR